MVAGADVVCHQSISVLDVQYRISKGNNIQKIDDIVVVSPTSPPLIDQIRTPDSVSTDNSRSEGDAMTLVTMSDDAVESAIIQFVPSIRSGSFADIGPRRFMEDEHIRIDDLSTQMGSLIRCPKPSAFYGVFDGHGGSDAASYIRKNAIRFFFEDADFPELSEDVNDIFLEKVENSVRKAFLLADLALADDRTISSSSGTTALTALVLGRLLLVANAGDCRAVLCRKGEAIDMSQDHKPIYPSELKRVKELGGYVDDGYLNGVLSVSRALGDWDMKLPRGSASPLSGEPEFRQMILTEDDEFLIIGCDGIWDVMSSEHAVGIVRRGLRRHDDPERSARDLVMEALRLNTFDNLTVIVVCFSSPDHQREPSPPRPRKLKCCSLSAEALCSLRNLLDGSGGC